MAMMAGEPAMDDNKGESNECMPSGFPEDVEPPPQRNRCRAFPIHNERARWRREGL